MKYYKLSFILFLVAVFFVTCKTEEELATKKAKEFLEYINAKKYSNAKEIATPESEAMIDFMKSMASLGSGEKPKAIKNLNCRINRDTAHCTYIQGDEEKSLDLVKLNHKWLVDMKKESPDVTKTDSTNYSDNSEYVSPVLDTITYFDVVLSEMKDVNGTAQLMFQFTNRSNWNISHLWFEVYISDTYGKFIKQKQMIFDGILKHSMLENISNADEIKEKGKIVLSFENTRIDDIGEIYLYPFRIRMEPDYYDSYPEYLDNFFSFTKQYTLIKNNTDFNVKITFE